MTGDVSKMVADGVKSQLQVEAGDVRFRPEMMGALTEKHGEEVAQAVDLVLDSFKQRASATKDAMVEAEAKLSGERADLVSPRGGREGAKEANMDYHGLLRAVFDNVYPPEVSVRYKLTGRLPRDPDTVLLLTQHIVKTYDSEGLPAPRLDMPIDVAPTIEKLRAAGAELEAELANVRKEERDVEVAVTEKNEAMDEFNEAFQEYAGLTSLMLQVAGRDEYARRLRPSTARPGQTQDVASGGTGELDAPGADTDAA